MSSIKKDISFYCIDNIMLYMIFKKSCLDFDSYELRVKQNHAS
jgi:hypothetical protein